MQIRKEFFTAGSKHVIRKLILVMIRNILYKKTGKRNAALAECLISFLHIFDCP